MDTLTVDLERNAKTMLRVEETIEEGREEKQDAPESAALGASSVAFATSHPTTEYTTEAELCQVVSLPSLDAIEAQIASAERERIENAFRELEATRERLGRERIAREKAGAAMQNRVSEVKTKLANLADEREKMEEKARAFLGGEALKAILEKIHLAFNARQLELEADLKDGEAAVAEALTESQAVEITDALELQLDEQELERLEGAAPEAAEQVRLRLAAAENLIHAHEAVQEGMLQDAAVLLEQARAGGADPAEVAEAERELTEAQGKKPVRDLIARITSNPDQVGATRRIHRLMEEARKAGVAEQVAPFANTALDKAREAANARFLQARPIADHLANEGYVPVVGDGRIEAWREVKRNGNGTRWSLEQILTLRGKEGWTTETPRNLVTEKQVPARVRHSRWYRPTCTDPAH